MKKELLIFMGLLLLVFFSCKKNNTINPAPDVSNTENPDTSSSTDSTAKYQIITLVSPENSGSVSLSDKDYENGDTIKIVAKTDKDHVFKYWSGLKGTGIDSTKDTISVVVNRNYDLTAHFSNINYKIKTVISPDGSGTVSLSNEKYTNGDKVDITAEANKGYVFKYWEGLKGTSIDSTKESISITVNKDYNLTAYFSIIKCKLTIDTIGSGFVSSSPSSDDSTYNYGTVVTLTAKSSEAGWGFKEWEDGASGTINSIKFTITQDTSITAVFEKKEFYLLSNGVTVGCPLANVGESGVINGITYTKRTKQQIMDNPSLASTSCTSEITDMSNMFTGKSKFNEDISTWDVSNVTDMSYIFYMDTVFNRDISHWDVSKVTNMKYMFAQDTSFNQDISKWDVSNVTDMEALIMYNRVFNSDLSDWDVSKVTNMHLLFFQCKAFNSDISHWNVSNVTNMLWMLGFASAFNADLSGWCVQHISSYPQNFAAWTKMNFAADAKPDNEKLPKWGTCP